MRTPPIEVSSEVRGALDTGAPTVALESTVIAHGLPQPRNLEVAARLERIVREEGACPATIGLISGRPIVGLTRSEIALLGTEPDVAKASARDLGALVGRGRHAATTVAASLVLAERVGIRVFATGGIGGVHRGGERTLDVSADLETLARTPVAVVCAGAKAILDLPRTLERLETLGVPLIGLGTADFPAFYTAHSGLRLEHDAADPDVAAGMIEAHWALGLGSAVVICNPPPPEAALEREEVDAWTERSLSEAESAGITGKSVTPWLLDRLAVLSGGRTVETNVALLESNARVAARIAVALACAGG